MSITASARRRGHTLRHEIDVNGRHTIVTDEPRELGGTDTAPAPHELLPAALAGCIATMIALYAKRRSRELGDVVVEVDYDQDAVPRHFDVVVQVAGDLAPGELERLRRVAEACPVRRALATGFSFDERFLKAPERAASP